jgi:adenylylsulfate kinase
MKESKRNETSGVIWNVGLSGSGKTTLLHAIRRKLLQTHSNVVSLDGDAIRECIRNTKSFSVENRIEQFQRMQKLAREFEKQGLIVILATLYCNHSLLNDNRNLFKNYFEIYSDVPLERLIKEDQKSIYRDYLSGKLKDVVGMDIAWIPPDHPNMITSKYDADPGTMANEVIQKIPFL